MQETENSRVLVVCAHPDDVDVNAAGTLHQWALDGAEITLLVVTSGDAGGHGSVERESIVATRQAEQRAAAKLLGLAETRFLEGYRDGEVTVTAELVRDITRVIRQIQPSKLMTMSTERDWSNIAQGHPDHLAVGEAAVRAFYPFARNPHAFPGQADMADLQHWVVEELWLQAPPNPNKIIDVTDVLEQKLAAILCHASQFEDPEAVSQFLRQRMLESGARHGLGEGRAAETFTVVCGRH